MRKFLLTLFAVLTATFAMGQKVTLDFTENSWGLPEGSAAKAFETATFSNGTYAVTLTASEDGGYYFNAKDGYLMLGKQGASLQFPKFDFAVGKIVITGRAGASGKTVMNIYVGENEASTATTGSVEPNTYAIAEAYQAAGTAYVLKVASAHNAQITKIEVFQEGEEPGPQPQGENFEAALTDAKGNWTYEDVVLPEDLTYIWAQSSSYGMKATAFANQTKYVSESYLVSPAIILKEGSVLSFDHVSRYAAEDPATQLTLWVRENGAANWAAQLAIPTYSDGSNWTFVGSGDIDLSAYAGKTIQLGFRYTSSEDFAATWEIKNVKVTNAKAAEEGPQLIDPTNQPTAPYTVAQAIEIIKNKDQYDMSKEVYVKGQIVNIKSIDVSQYVRAQYWIADQVGGDSIQVYNGYYLGGADFTANDQIKVGDEVVVLGKLTLYNTTYEIEQNNQIYSLNGKTAEGEPTDPYAKVEEISIAKFLENADPDTMYKLTGVVRNLKNATYGNFDLCDKDNEDVKIYIYGVVKQDDLENNKIWSSLGVAEGDVLTIVGTYTTYNDAPQIAKAVYIKHEKGSEPVVSIENTPETAYTATEAVALIDAGQGLSANVYVKGTISQVGIEKNGEMTDLPGNSYGNATYFITDGQTTLEVYRGYYIGNEKFTAEDQIKVGDEVIVYGQLTKYGETYEMNKNNYIYSLNGVTNGIGNIKVAKSGAIFDLSGRRVEKAQKGIYIVNGRKFVK